MPSYKKKQNKLIEDVKGEYHEPINHLDSFLKPETKIITEHNTIIDDATQTSNNQNHNVIEENQENDEELIECEYTHLDIKNKVDKLSENELSEIFKIIKSNNEKFTINKNGIFVNLNSLKKESLHDISKFIFFCEKNDKKFDEEERTREFYKQYVTN